jgi:hypothetical protein
MADQIPEQTRPEEESKKDTVRINLPHGLAGRSSAPVAPTAAPGTRSVPAAGAEEEAKKETAVLGRPAEAPKPKQETSRVQVAASKPAVPEAPRPTVKLRREDEAPAPTPIPAAAKAPSTTASASRAATAAPSGAAVGLSLVAIVLSIAMAGYLAMLAFS